MKTVLNRCACFCVLASCGIAFDANAENPKRAYAAFNVSYSSGDYGTDFTSELFSGSVEAGVLREHFDASVLFSYARIESEDDFSESGLGDVLARVGGTLFQSSDESLSLYGSTSVKFPTADEDNGLGTGEPDLGVFLSLRKQWGDSSAFLFGGYLYTGDPAGIEYNDVALYGAGLSHLFTNSSAYVSLEGGQSTVDDFDNPLEAHLGYFYFVSSHYTFMLGGFAGLSDGSADYGINTGVIAWY